MKLGTLECQYYKKYPRSGARVERIKINNVAKAGRSSSSTINLTVNSDIKVW